MKERILNLIEEKNIKEIKIILNEMNSSDIAEVLNDIEYKTGEKNNNELFNRLHYVSMDKSVRELALKDKLATAEKLAVMTTEEICDLIVEKYEVVMCEYEDILLIPKDKMKEFNKMAVYISR